MENIVIQAPTSSWGGPSGKADPAPPRRVPQGPLKLSKTPISAPLPETSIRFRFRTRYVRATRTQVDHVHDNVYRLHIHSFFAQRYIHRLADYLPPFMLFWINTLFPEWSLPPQIILKKEKEHEGWGKEKETYTKLSALQGLVIPRLLGEIKCDNGRALLLSDIGGVSLATPEGALLQLSTFRQMLCRALDALAENKVMQDDIKLDNFHLVDDKIMVVDLEQVHSLSEEQRQSAVTSAANHLTERYIEHQLCCLADNDIEEDV